MSWNDQALALNLAGLQVFMSVFLNVFLLKVLKRWFIFIGTHLFVVTARIIKVLKHILVSIMFVCACYFPFTEACVEKKQPVYNGWHWARHPPHSSSIHTHTHTSSFKGSLANFPLFMDHLISPCRASPISCIHWTHHERAGNYSLHRNNWTHSLGHVW